ncbi:MAG: site-specific integrase [Bacteroidales bacterium]|jgi:integrase|nr:site-specific integrase [Bacteroidales bacterium]
MDIKRKCLFFLDKEGNEKDGYKSDAKVRLRIRYNKDTIVAFNVGYRVELSKWIKEAQRCKVGTTHGKKKISATVINNEIQRLEKLVDDVFKSFEVNNHIPTAQEYRDVFNKMNGIDNDNFEIEIKRSISDYIDEFTKTMGRQNNWTNSTYAKFKTLNVHLTNFNKDIDISTISESDLQNFVQYLFDLGMRNTTISKNVAFVRWLLRWAHKKGYYSGTLHDSFRPKFKGTDGNSKEVIHLTWEELMQLLNYQLPESKQYLDRVRDVFCFTCFTGLRYSDVAKLRRSDIKPNHIEVVTQKTVDGLKIELNKYSRAILEKYADYHFEDDKALPVISNVKMNVYLKELGEIVGINEPQRIIYFKGNERFEEVYPKYDLLTTHCGRRTFIVNALYLGIPSEVIMKWTGHSDYKAMKPYVKIVDALKESEMDKFNRV